MALIKCSHCGQPVSDSAKQCPYCKKKLMTVKKMSLIAMLLSIVGAILMFVFGGFMGFDLIILAPLVFVACLICFVEEERQRKTIVKIGMIISLLIVIMNIIRVVGVIGYIVDDGNLSVYAMACILYFCLMVATAVLFYRMYKHTRLK